MTGTPPSLCLAVCIDKGILLGLHVTLRTALTALTDDVHTHIHVFHDHLGTDEFALLEQTLSATGRSYECFYHLLNPARFQKMRNHVGQGWMAYARLLIPELLEADRVIYLDADIIVRADLHELFKHPLDGHSFGAASWGSIGESNDRRFFEQQNTCLESPYFNSGVLLIDIPRWRKDEVTMQCMDVGERFGGNLPSADQTILNYLFSHDHASIPRRFNTPVTASRRPLATDDWENRIVHLVARPKPWDPLGSLNGQSDVWFEEFAKTSISNRRLFKWASLTTHRLIARLGGAYWKCVSRRITDRVVKEWRS